MTYLNRDSAQKILDTRPQGTSAQDALKVLANKGFTIEGYNDGTKGSINEPSTLQKVGGAIKNVATDITQPFESVGGSVKAGVEAVGGYLGNKKEYNQAGMNLKDVYKAQLEKNNQDNTLTNVISGGATQAPARDITTGQGVEQLAGDLGKGLLNVATLEDGSIVNPVKSSIGALAKQGAKLGAGFGATTAMQEGDNAKDVLISGLEGGATGAILGAGLGVASKGISKGINLASNLKNKTKNIISKVDVKAPELFPIDAPDNIKTSLNPFLTNTKAEISVPTKNGFILKTIDKITPEEKIAVQKETNNLYSKLENTAKQFKEDRRDILSPLEIVGQRTDKLGLEKVNKLRISEGKKMGEIENIFKDETVDLSGNKLNNFINEFLGSEKKFGRTVKDKTFMEDFAKDYDKLTKNPNVKDTLDFNRTWTNELEDLKDNFGAFKDNKRTYTLIEGAINDIKNNTRDLIAKDNKEYARALSNYRLTSKIREEANRLMGKEGLAGERLKGGALAKRAVQSSSDAGARQFYNILKKVTGYDGLKEADIALQAMKDVGDYQGLSLLEVNKDLYNATVGKIVSSIPGGQAVSETTKAFANKIVPQEKRVKKLINK